MHYSIQAPPAQNYYEQKTVNYASDPRPLSKSYTGASLNFREKPSSVPVGVVGHNFRQDNQFEVNKFKPVEPQRTHSIFIPQKNIKEMVVNQPANDIKRVDNSKSLQSFVPPSQKQEIKR